MSNLLFTCSDNRNQFNFLLRHAFLKSFFKFLCSGRDSPNLSDIVTGEKAKTLAYGTFLGNQPRPLVAS